MFVFAFYLDRNASFSSVVNCLKSSFDIFISFCSLLCGVGMGSGDMVRRVAHRFFVNTRLVCIILSCVWSNLIICYHPFCLCMCMFANMQGIIGENFFLCHVFVLRL